MICRQICYCMDSLIFAITSYGTNKTSKRQENQVFYSCRHLTFRNIFTCTCNVHDLTNIDRNMFCKKTQLFLEFPHTPTRICFRMPGTYHCYCLWVLNLSQIGRNEEMLTFAAGFLIAIQLSGQQFLPWNSVDLCEMITETSSVRRWSHWVWTAY